MIVTTGGRGVRSSSASVERLARPRPRRRCTTSTFLSNSSASTPIASSESVWVIEAISPSCHQLLDHLRDLDAEVLGDVAHGRARGDLDRRPPRRPRSPAGLARLGRRRAAPAAAAAALLRHRRRRLPARGLRVDHDPAAAPAGAGRALARGHRAPGGALAGAAACGGPWRPCRTAAPGRLAGRCRSRCGLARGLAAGLRPAASGRCLRLGGCAGFGGRRAAGAAASSAGAGRPVSPTRRRPRAPWRPRPRRPSRRRPSRRRRRPGARSSSSLLETPLSLAIS